MNSVYDEVELVKTYNNIILANTDHNMNANVVESTLV